MPTNNDLSPSTRSVIQGARLVEPKQPKPRAADILIKGDTIHEIGTTKKQS